MQADFGGASSGPYEYEQANACFPSIHLKSWAARSSWCDLAMSRTRLYDAWTTREHYNTKVCYASTKEAQAQALSILMSLKTVLPRGSTPQGLIDHLMAPSLSPSPLYHRSLPEPANLERALVQPPERPRPLQQLRRLHRRLRRQYPRPTEPHRVSHVYEPERRNSTHPQCIASAFFARTSLKISTASAGDACKFDHIARGAYALPYTQQTLSHTCKKRGRHTRWATTPSQTARASRRPP